MVVRLKDLQNKSEEQPKKKGLTRLSDLKEAIKPNREPTAFDNAISSRSISDPNLMMIGQTPRIQQAQKFAASQPAVKEELPGRNVPVIGSILKGLDYVGEKVEDSGVAPFLRSLYTPGAGLANIASATGAVGTGLTKTAMKVSPNLAPKLESTLGGRVIQEAVKEGVTGVPVGIGQSLSSGETDLGEATKEGLLWGGLGGGAAGAALPVVGRGLKRLSDIAGDRFKTASKAVDESPQLTRVETDISTPTREIEATKTNAINPATPEVGERALFRNIEQSDKLTPETRQGLKNVDREYTPITNQETVQKANQRIVNDGIDAAESYVLNTTGKMDAERIATGFRLIDELQKSGNTQRAVSLADNLAKELTNAGQTVQAASIYNKLTPEGALVAAQRIVNRVNDQLPKWSKEVKISDQAANDISNAATAIQRTGASQERAANVLDIMDRVRAGQAITDEEKQVVADFVKDAQQFVKPQKAAVPKEAVSPKEMAEPRVRDKVVSFLDQQEKAALERIRARRGRLSSTPLDEWADYVIVGASRLGKGTVKFADWSQQMIRDIGEEVRPYLTEIYEKAQNTLSNNVRKISQETLGRAKTAASQLSDELAAHEEEKLLIDELSDKVRNVISKIKSGKVTNDELQEIREISEQVAAVPSKQMVIGEEHRYRSQVKSLAKKIANVQSEKVPSSTSMKELQKLIRDVAKINEEGLPKGKKPPLESADAINKLAYGLKQRTRPTDTGKKEKELVKKLSEKVRTAIDSSKNGEIGNDILQEIREISKEINKVPSKPRVMTEEQQILSQIKSLAKKVANVEIPKVTRSEQVREVSKLVRDIEKLTNEGKVKEKLPDLNKEAISQVAYGIKEQKKPAPKSQQEKIADSYIKKNKERLTESDIDSIRNLAVQVSELAGSAKQAASQDLQAVLSGFERAGIGRKISSAQYISMLLNPVTQVRNVVGNELMYRLERLSRALATPIDAGLSKLTGKDRQITFRSGPATWENFFRPTTDYWKGLIEGGKSGWRGVNPEGLTTAYDINGQAFRSKLNPLTYLEKTLGAVMKGFDYAAFNRAANQRLREMAYMDALNQGVKGKDNIGRHIDRYISNLDSNIDAIAKEYGKYVTLQDNTALSSALSSFKRGANKLTTGSKDFGLGSVVLPFAKTPANLLMRAIDYSPAGFLKSIGQTYKVLAEKNTDLTRADVIQSVTRALLGSGLGGAGLWLASKGVLRGESSSDRDVRELEKQAGLSQYQLNASAVQRMFKAMITGNLSDVDAAAKIKPGDVMYQYEWAQPTSIPLALGANVVQERKQAARDAAKGQKTDSGLKQGYDITTGALNTLFNTSVLQGLQQAFDLPPGEDNKIKAVSQNIIKQLPGMFVPSTVGKINQSGDNAVRETYSPEFIDTVLNPSKAKIPGLAQQLPQRVDTLGKPQTRENSFFDVFMTPAQRSVYKPSEQAKTVIDLLSETGDDKLAPRAVDKYITGKDRITGLSKRVDLTGEQYVKYQTIVGQETAKLLGRIGENWSTERKIKAVLNALDTAGEKGRTQMRKELGLK